MYKLLIVDDSELCRKPYRDVAQNDDGTAFLEIAEAGTGEAGLEYFKEHTDIRYAVVDIHLPGISGVKMLRQMKEFDPERFSKIQIFMTCTETFDHHHEDGPYASYSSTSLMLKPVNAQEFGKFLLEDFQAERQNTG